MSHPSLLEYIRQARQRGASDTDISRALTDAGWYTVDVQDAFGLYARLTGAPLLVHTPPAMPPAPTPAQLPQIHVASQPVHSKAVRHYDPSVVAIAALAFAIGFVGFYLLAR